MPRVGSLEHPQISEVKDLGPKLDVLAAKIRQLSYEASHATREAANLLTAFEVILTQSGTHHDSFLAELREGLRPLRGVVRSMRVARSELASGVSQMEKTLLAIVAAARKRKP